jgi:hypothetical protein
MRIPNRIRKAIQQAGCVLDESSNGDTQINIDAPAGFSFVASGTHTLVVNADRLGHATVEDWDDLLDRLRVGLGPCNDTDCDFCMPS